jgi:hypothetical protein
MTMTMTMNYRKLFVLSVLVFDLLLLAGCTTTWVTEAQGIVAVLLPAALNILAVITALSGKTITPGTVSEISTITAKITASLTLINSLITSYTIANATTLIPKIDAALADIQGNLASILTLANVSDPATTAKITALVGLFESEIESLVALLPIIKDGADMETLKAAMSTSKLLDAKHFEKSWKAVLAKPTGDTIVDGAVATVVANN